MSRTRSGPPRAVTRRAEDRPAGRVRAAQKFWQLPDHELNDLIMLTRQTDRVELKLIVPATAHRTTRAALGIDFTRAPARRVYYLDTPDRTLHHHGVIARVRSIEDKPDDAVVKLRPVVPASLSDALRRSKDLIVEIDGMPGTYVCSAALKTRLGPHDVDQAIAHRRPLHALFSPPQRTLLATWLPRHTNIDDLMVLGPVDVRRRKVVPDGYGRTLLAERWTFPDGSRILELSTRCAPDAALHVAAHTAAVLRRHGVALTGPQQTKTRTTLDFFTPPPADR
ncbi:adenylate cyclase [Candidatus Protofrankia californiensis]|uniref:adenylate cyclase n=1 Tax=Candidatus Protofrankia californiensis TaxID=1839754 RepID=UPI001F499189|nr:adenylate cyclase [Candidatus Protofrankia californiensis]